MNARNDQEGRDAQPTANQEGESVRRPTTERVESRSVRILFESSSPHRCDHCGEAIGENTTYRNVTVRNGSGAVSEYSFCDRECSVSRFGQRGADRSSIA